MEARRRTLEDELASGVEVIRGRLYWVALHAIPRDTSNTHYFSTDDEFVYEPFAEDFGPLCLSMVYRFCRKLEDKLADPSLEGKRILHCCSHDPKKRTNAACLICFFQVAVMGISAEAAFQPFRSVDPPFLPYRDASGRPCTFQLTMLDCLRGLEEGMKRGWFDMDSFDIDSYEFFQDVEHGDMNWIIPNRFLAFAEPYETSADEHGLQLYTPEDCAEVFEDARIGLVVRLNRIQYDRQRFIARGIKHVDLYFRDGSCPPSDIITRFLHIAEREPGAIAVHCKAGLGRTGTLIALYAMKHFLFPARAFIAWNRLCRPGSILGPQQQFLVDMQGVMFQAGAALRPPTPPPALAEADVWQAPPPQQPLAEQEFEQRAANARLWQAEHHEDVGQGERLCSAKRSASFTQAQA